MKIHAYTRARAQVAKMCAHAYTYVLVCMNLSDFFLVINVNVYLMSLSLKFGNVLSLRRYSTFSNHVSFLIAYPES